MIPPIDPPPFPLEVFVASMPDSPPPTNANSTSSPDRTGASPNHLAPGGLPHSLAPGGLPHSLAPGGSALNRKLTYRHRRPSGNPRPDSPTPPPTVAAETEQRATIQTQRVDASHDGGSLESRPNPAEVNQLAHHPHESPSIDRDKWLRLHAAELIRRLQLWATGLDAREANLNAAYAKQDLRERKFRFQQMEFQNEMSEARRSMDDLRKQIDAQCRRLAFESFA